MNFKYPFQTLNILRFCAGRPKAVTNAIRGQRRLEGRRLRADGRGQTAIPHIPARARLPRQSQALAAEGLRQPHAPGGAVLRSAAGLSRGGLGWLGAGLGWLGAGLRRRALGLRVALGCRAGRRRYGRVGPLRRALLAGSAGESPGAAPQWEVRGVRCAP